MVSSLTFQCGPLMKEAGGLLMSRIDASSPPRETIAVRGQQTKAALAVVHEWPNVETSPVEQQQPSFKAGQNLVDTKRRRTSEPF